MTDTSKEALLEIERLARQLGETQADRTLLTEQLAEAQAEVEHQKALAEARIGVLEARVARLQSGAVKVDLEKVARAWAGIDGKAGDFDHCKINPEYEEQAGYYAGYMADAEELIKRAAIETTSADAVWNEAIEAAENVVLSGIYDGSTEADEARDIDAKLIRQLKRGEV